MHASSTRTSGVSRLLFAVSGVLIIGIIAVSWVQVTNNSAGARPAQSLSQANDWPVMISYDIDYPEGYFGPGTPAGTGSWQFVGSSWSSWSLELTTGDAAGECVVHGEYESPNACVDQGSSAGKSTSTEADVARGASMWLRPGAPGLADGLDRVNTPQIISAAVDEIEFNESGGDPRTPPSIIVYSSPEVANCDTELDECPLDVIEGELHRVVLDPGTGLVLIHETIDEHGPGATFRITSATFGVG